MRNDLELLRSHGIDRSAIYPGHPVTLAFCIVHTFSTYEEAFRYNDQTYVQALGDIRIPGAGGNVCEALLILKFLKDGKPFDDAMADADRLWSHCDSQQTRNPLRWKEGQDQANLIKPLLRKKRAWWKQ